MPRVHVYVKENSELYHTDNSLMRTQAGTRESYSVNPA